MSAGSDGRKWRMRRGIGKDPGKTVRNFLKMSDETLAGEEKSRGAAIKFRVIDIVYERK